MRTTVINFLSHNSDISWLLQRNPVLRKMRMRYIRKKRGMQRQGRTECIPKFSSFSIQLQSGCNRDKQNLNLSSPLYSYPSLVLFSICCFLLKQQYIQAHLFTFKKVKISLSGVNITNSCLASQKKKERERQRLSVYYLLLLLLLVCVCVCVLKTLENILSLQFPLEILITTSMVLL